MSTRCEVRWAQTGEELDWINEQYKEIEFLPSLPRKDRVALASIGSKWAGMGRLVPLEKGAYELGGIYVLPSFRGEGVARMIVEFLVHQSNGDLYCLPFSHLAEFYCSFGFQRVDTAPTEVIEKHRWCNETYSEDVWILMKKS